MLTFVGLDDQAGNQRELEEAERLGADLSRGAFIVGVEQLFATASELKGTSDPTGDDRQIRSRITDLDMVPVDDPSHVARVDAQILTKQVAMQEHAGRRVPEVIAHPHQCLVDEGRLLPAVFEGLDELEPMRSPSSRWQGRRWRDGMDHRCNLRDDRPRSDRLPTRTKIDGHAFDEALDQDRRAVIVDECDGPWHSQVDGMSGEPAQDLEFAPDELCVAQGSVVGDQGHIGARLPFGVGPEIDMACQTHRA